MVCPLSVYLWPSYYLSSSLKKKLTPWLFVGAVFFCWRLRCRCLFPNWCLGQAVEFDLIYSVQPSRRINGCNAGIVVSTPDWCIGVTQNIVDCASVFLSSVQKFSIMAIIWYNLDFHLSVCHGFQENTKGNTLTQMAHFSFPSYFTIPNSEFRTPNSEFRIPNFTLRISEFGIVKYM